MRGCGVGKVGGLARAPAFPKAIHDCRNRIGDTWRCFGTTDRAEDVVEGVSLDAGGKQGVPGEQQVFVSRLQFVGDVGEQLEGQLGIQEGIAYLHPRQCRFLILLDEVMVGVFRVCQRAEIERVNGRQVEQFEVRRMLGQEFEIVLDDVVPDQVRGSCGEFVQSCQGRGQSTTVAAPREGRGAVGAYRADRADVCAALEVYGEQAGKLMRRQARPCPLVVSPPLDCHWCWTQHTNPLSLAEAAAARHGRQKISKFQRKSHPFQNRQSEAGFRRFRPCSSTNSLGTSTRNSPTCSAGKCFRLPVTTQSAPAALATSTNIVSAASGNAAPNASANTDSPFASTNSSTASTRSLFNARRPRVRTSRYSARMRSSKQSVMLPARTDRRIAPGGPFGERKPDTRTLVSSTILTAHAGARELP